MVRTKTLNKGDILLILLTSILFFIMIPNMVLLNASANGGVSSEDAERELTSDVRNELASNGKTYETTGGGYLGGAELFIGSEMEGYDLDEAKFSTLTSDAQTEVVSDIAEASNASVGDGGVTDETVDNWWKHLQSMDGVGSKFLATVLEDTKPDFVTAKKWYQPFSGPIGTLLALGSILAMSLIGVVIVADILYITIPPVRLFVDDSATEGSGKAPISKIFSHAAISAVKQAEQDTDGKSKHALGIYFKNRVIELVVLSICLLYLVQGQIYTLVGKLLDLLSGITG